MATPRYDKYEPKAGGFRAPLSVAWVLADVGKIWGVGLNSSGRLVKGAGQTGILGVVIIREVKAAGDVVDVMKAGDIADFALLADGSTAVLAGTNYYVSTSTGVLTATATGVYVGTTVEVGRLMVQVLPLRGAVASLAESISLTDLSDVTITTPSNTQVLKYNGTIWVNAADAT